METEKQQEKTRADLIKTIVGISLCVIFGLIFIINMTIIVKGIVNPSKMPSVFGVTPVAIKTESMSGDRDGHLEKGDLAFVKKADIKDLVVGDVITFKDSETTYRTHRIVEIDANGKIYTAGDALGDTPATRDRINITQETLAGKVTGRIPLIGYFALWFENPMILAGVILVIVIGFVAIDILRRRKEEKVAEDSKTSELEAELERLRALAAANNLAVDAQTAPETAAEATADTATAEAPAEQTVETEETKAEE